MTCRRNSRFAALILVSLSLVRVICSAVCGVVAFLFREVAEQLADAGVGGAAGGGLVKAPGFHFHGLGGLLDGLQAERPHEPDGFPVHKTAHVLPPDVRDVVAEAALVKFQQAVAMAVLFAAHGAEFFGLFGIIGLQAVGEILVDAGVFLFQRNGQREDFLFGQAVECFHK